LQNSVGENTLVILTNICKMSCDSYNYLYNFVCIDFAFNYHIRISFKFRVALTQQNLIQRERIRQNKINFIYQNIQPRAASSEMLMFTFVSSKVGALSLTSMTCTTILMTSKYCAGDTETSRRAEHAFNPGHRCSRSSDDVVVSRPFMRSMPKRLRTSEDDPPPSLVCLLPPVRGEDGNSRDEEVSSWAASN